MQDYTKGFLITTAGVVIISPDTLLIRMIDADSWTQLFWRGLLSGLVILLGHALLTRGRFFSQLRGLGLSGLMVAVAFSLGTACFMYSAAHTLIANTLFITATSPVFAAIFSWVFLREPVSLRTALTIVASLAGIAIIASGSGVAAGEGQVQATFAGDVAALGSAVSLAATFTFTRARRAISMVPAMGLAGLISAVMALFISANVSLVREDWPWIALMGLLVVPLGFGLMTTGPRYLPSPDVSLLLLLEAVLGPLFVWAALSEYPGERTLMGGAVILTALIVSNVTRRRSRG